MARKKRSRLVPEAQPQEPKPRDPEPSSDDDLDDDDEVEDVEEDSEEEEDDGEEEEGSEEEEEEKGEESEEEYEEIKPSDKEALRKLLEPFGKDQLLEILKDAALKNPAVASRLATASRSDPVHRKIFVHGLSWDATTDVLRASFAPFGDIEECRAVADRATGRCKGYGFVLFRSRSAAQRALKEPQKRIGGRNTSCQLAAYGAPANQPLPEPTGRKIFVTNVGDSVNPERLRAFFANFGEIEEGPLGYDRNTGKLRGFAIFVYKTVEGCKKALEEPKKVFEGFEIHVQRAMEGMKPKAAPSSSPAVAALQPNDLALAHLNALSPNPVAGLLGPVGGVGLLSQAAGLSPAVSRSAATPPSPLGVGVGLGGAGLGINSISPSVIGNYGPQAALQGLGAYRSGQVSGGTRTPPGTGGNYLGR